MAERKWTARQLEAIEADGTLTVLSAAAGSGKTTVLVEKALRILLDEQNRTPADRLLIVTFSNASAKEFKNRIEKGINEAIRRNPENSYIKSQKVLLQKADISTIHSFCIKLARENFEALDIPPDFSICDDAQAGAIHEKAIDMAMEYGYENTDFRSFVTIFGKSSQDKQIREFLKDMFYYFSALPFPEKRAVELAELAQQEKFEDTEIYRYLWQDIGNQADYVLYLAKRIVQLCDEGGVDSYRNGAALILKQMQQLKENYDSGNVFMVKSLSAEKPASLGRVKSGEKSVYSEAVRDVNDILKKQLAALYGDMEYLDSDRYLHQSAQTSRYIRAMTDVFVFYSQKLIEIKKHEKAFEFSDFEHFAVRLLVNENGGRTPLAQTLSERYVKIMEDEFQDTSFVQDMIFKTIAKDNEQNLFVVGDVKQSIYGFRKASPEILLEKRSRQDKNPLLGKTVVLPNNFRSTVGLIKGVNTIFENIMTQGLGGVDYAGGEQLQPAPGREDTGEEAVTVMIAADKENEAAMVADKIAQMVKEGYEISENGTNRRVTYSDFCILLRNKKRFDEFSDALKSRGIKSFVKDEKPLLEKPEIQSIISLLKVINNPLQEVYLTAGMFGDIFGFTLDEILGLKVNNKRENLYRLLAQSEDEKAKNFLSVLQDFSFASKIYSPDKLIDYIVGTTGYYRNLAFSENGSAKRENIRRFIAFAKGYITGYQNYLGDLLRYTDLVAESGKGGSENFRQPADTVAIMTMHTSKGLEFPVCFVSGLGTAFNKMDRAKRLMIDPVLGMATYANESFGHNLSTAGIQAIKKKVLAANADDEMRLLYVALTRAKNRMFLTAQYTNVFTASTFEKIYEKTGEKPSEYALRRANAPVEWVLAGFIRHPNFADGVFVKAQETEKHFAGLEIVQYSGTQSQGGADDENTQEAAIPQMPFDETKARENLGFVYADEAKTRLPIKVSVGEVAKSAPKLSLKKPVFAKQQSFSAAEKGTQMHLFAQHSDIVLARANLENEITRLCDAGITDRRLLNVNQIERFVSSKVANIILNGEKVYKEKEFLVPFDAAEITGDKTCAGETVMVQGVIDCLVINGNEGYIIDYKTDRVDDMQTLYERYSKQLEMYRRAGSYLYGTDSIKCIIYSFHLGEYTEF